MRLLLNVKLVFISAKDIYIVHDLDILYLALPYLIQCDLSKKNSTILDIFESKLNDINQENHNLFKNIILNSDNLEEKLKNICEPSEYTDNNGGVKTIYKYSKDKLISWIKKKIQNPLEKENNSLEKIKKKLEIISEYLPIDLYDQILKEYSISKDELIQKPTKRRPDEDFPYKTMPQKKIKVEGKNQQLKGNQDISSFFHSKSRK